MEITANAIQTVNANNNVLFTDVAVPGCASMIHRDGSGLVTLRGLTRTQTKARFRVSFGGNIAIPTDGTTGAITLAIALNGESVNTTTMIATEGAVNSYLNVGADIFIDVPCGCCTQLSVKNTSTQAINVQNANLIVERVA